MQVMLNIKLIEQAFLALHYHAFFGRLTIFFALTLGVLEAPLDSRVGGTPDWGIGFIQIRYTAGVSGKFGYNNWQDIGKC